MHDNLKNSNLYIVFGPSGAGKTSLVRQLVADNPAVACSVSYTTRAMRPGEVDGVHYHFVDIPTFEAMKSRGDFLEYAEVFGNFYGTSEPAVRTQLASDTHVILEIDWQGARQVRERFADAISICILPPSRKELEVRLNSRGQDDAAVIAKRMAAAQAEMAHYSECDYLVINKDYDSALEQLRQLLAIGDLCIRLQKMRHQSMIAELLA